MRESDKLKTVLAIYEQQTKTSIKAELSEVEDHDRCMDQKIRTRNFEARNDRMTGVLVKTQEGKNALTGNQEIAVSGKQKDSVQSASPPR